MVKAIDSVPVLGTVVSAAIATAACGPGAPACIAAATVASDAVQAGGTSGKVGTAFKVAAIELGQAAAFNVVGSLTAGNFLLNVAGHAAVGCAFTAAGGGSCEAGAASAGLAALSTPVISAAFPNAGLEVTDMNRALEFGSALTASAVMGGVGSVIGGGKFQNGAVTGAFGYLFSPGSSNAANDNQNGLQGIPVVGRAIDDFETLRDQVQSEIGDLFGSPASDFSHDGLPQSGLSPSAGQQVGNEGRLITCDDFGCFDQHGTAVNDNQQAKSGCVASFIRACGVVLGIVSGGQAIGTRPPPVPITPPPVTVVAPKKPD